MSTHIHTTTHTHTHTQPHTHTHTHTHTKLLEGGVEELLVDSDREDSMIYDVRVTKLVMAPAAPVVTSRTLLALLQTLSVAQHLDSLHLTILYQCSLIL